MPAPDSDLEFVERLKRIGARDLDAKGPLPDPTVVLETFDKEKVLPHHVSNGLTGGVTSSNIWRHPDAHPLALDILLLRKYGIEWMDWEIEALVDQLALDVPQSALSDLNVAKLQAVKALHMVDTFWERWEVFGWCTMALNSVFPDFEVMQVPTVAQCLVSVDIANRVRDDVTWSDEVAAYLKAVFQHDGLIRTLPPLDFVQLEAAGNSIDVAALAQRWAEVRKSETAPHGDSFVDEQLRHMLTAHQYLEQSRQRLRAQLEQVTNA